MRNTPKMTKGQFDALARALEQQRPAKNWENKRQQWEADVAAIAEVCHDASNFTPNGNRAFDMDRFLKACGLEKEGAAIW